jgi:hypothetical protein
MDCLVRRLLPPTSREAVAGDLWERYSSPLQYLTEAATTLPFVIASEMRRRTNWPVLALEGFVIFACFGGFVPPALHAPVPNWAIAALPCLCAFAALVLRDTYCEAMPSSTRRAFGDALAAALGAVLCEALLALLMVAQLLTASWLLAPVNAVVAVIALPILCVLRLETGRNEAMRPERSVSIDMLVRDYEHFARRVRWANRAEITALLVTMAGSVFLLLRYRLAFAEVAWAFQALCACVCVYLVFQGPARIPPCDGAFTSLSTLYQKELVRHHRLRRVMWWFWFAPLFIGLFTNFVLRGVVKVQPVLCVIGILFTALLVACIAALLRDRGRGVRRKVAYLTAITRESS